MAPPLADNSSGPSAPNSIYRFPHPTTKSTNALPKSEEPKPNVTMKPPTKTAGPATRRYICSPITSDAGRYFLHHRLILPTLLIPTVFLVSPPVIISTLCTLSYLVSSGHQGSTWGILVISIFVISLTACLVHVARDAIRNHAPNTKEMDKALGRSRYALPFWSLVFSWMVTRLLYSFVGHSVGGSSYTVSSGWFRWIIGLFTINWNASLLVIRSLRLPLLGWSMISLTILGRYIGPLSPYVKCSCVQLRINPFDATISRIGKNCTSKERFLDMIANVLEMLATPSRIGEKKPQVTSWNMPQQNNFVGTAGFSLKARYSRPNLVTIIIQVLLHAYAGHLFGHTVVLPLLEDGGMIHSNENATAATIILLSCILGSVLELLSSVHESELRFDSYSSFGKDFHQMFKNMKRWASIVVAAAITSAVLSHVWSKGHLFIHGHDVPILSSSMSIIMYSIMLSLLSTGVLVGIMGIQENLVRWAICVPDINPDLLLDKVIVKKTQQTKNLFLAEDLYVQSILMGDGATAEEVLSSTVARSKGPQEDEIVRNEQACASFAQWIKNSSTFHAGALSDDILRMCLLQSIGGNSNTQDKSILNRLRLSAATSSPGTQPIIVPLARSFLAFAGGLGESMTECFRQERKDGKIVVRNKNSDSWMLPPGSLTACAYAILGSARLVATNSSAEGRSRTKHLYLLSPCVLQSAFKLRSGIFEYALFEANASGANLSTPDGSGLLEFIETNHPELMPVISACDNSAKMVIKCLHDCGDEKVLLRWKGEIQSWIVNLNSQVSAS